MCAHSGPESPGRPRRPQCSGRVASACAALRGTAALGPECLLGGLALPCVCGKAPGGRGTVTEAPESEGSWGCRDRGCCFEKRPKRKAAVAWGPLFSEARPLPFQSEGWAPGSRPRGPGSSVGTALRFGRAPREGGRRGALVTRRQSPHRRAFPGRCAKD